MKRYLSDPGGIGAPGGERHARSLDITPQRVEKNKGAQGAGYCDKLLGLPLRLRVKTACVRYGLGLGPEGGLFFNTQVKLYTEIFVWSNS